MTKPTTPASDDAIEAAARALWYSYKTCVEWENGSAMARTKTRNRAKLVIDAYKRQAGDSDSSVGAARPTAAESTEASADALASPATPPAPGISGRGTGETEVQGRMTAKLQWDAERKAQIRRALSILGLPNLLFGRDDMQAALDEIDRRAPTSPAPRLDPATLEAAAKIADAKPTKEQTNKSDRCPECGSEVGIR